MTEIGAFEAKNTLGRLLDRVENGDEIVITRHGKPIARLVPYAGGVERELVRAAEQRIRMRAASFPHGTFDWQILKADRDADRPNFKFESSSQHECNPQGQNPSSQE